MTFYQPPYAQFFRDRIRQTPSAKPRPTILESLENETRNTYVDQRETAMTGETILTRAGLFMEQRKPT